MDERKRLTPKREAFAQLVVTLGNASEAYRQVYSTANMKPDTIKKEASRLTHAPAVATRIAELSAEVRQRNELTRDEVIEKFRRAYDMAEEDRAHGALSQAASGLARIGGYNKENVRLEDKRDDRISPSDMPPFVRERLEHEDRLLTPERIKAAIKADPAVMGLVDEWERAEQRVQSADDRGEIDWEALMETAKAKGELVSVLEQAEPDRSGDKADA